VLWTGEKAPLILTPVEVLELHFDLDAFVDGLLGFETQVVYLCAFILLMIMVVYGNDNW